MKTQKPIKFQDSFSKLKFLENRTPNTKPEEAKDAFASLTEYRDGIISIGHYSGNSEWERHSKGDEIVFALEGETTLFLLIGNEEVSHKIKKGELMIVPKNTWHRFETPDELKVMTVTPQPTDHSAEFPKL